MGNVVFDMSMSLDGYIQAAGATPEEPLGKGGERLHDWAMSPAPGEENLIPDAISQLGATICGRRTYDSSLPGWRADGPTGPARRPVVVVTHEAPEDPPEGGVYTFATGGIEDALRQAREIAGDKSISLMGGPNLGCQYLAPGLVDQVGVHLVPVLFGGGTRFFDEIGEEHIRLELVNSVATPNATHLLYNVVK